MGVKIGYPDRWCRDFSKLRIDRDHSFVQHQLNLNAFEADYQISQIGKARNPDEWLMSPQVHEHCLLVPPHHKPPNTHAPVGTCLCPASTPEGIFLRRLGLLH